MNKWAYLENIALIIMVGTLAYSWGSAWPPALLIFCNVPKSAGGSHD